MWLLNDLYEYLYGYQDDPLRDLHGYQIGPDAICVE